MNVVDSSGWLEYFANGSNADFFAPAITDEPHLIVPTICMFEVFKRLCVQPDSFYSAADVLWIFHPNLISGAAKLPNQAEAVPT